MGRRTKNRSDEVYLAFKQGAKIREYNVKIPHVYRLIMIPTEEGQTGQESKLFFVKPKSNLDNLVKEIETKYQYKIEKVEQYTEIWTDLCPRCHRRGIPKIEFKDAYDRRARRRSPFFYEMGKTEIHIKRPQEHWLTYAHKSIENNKTKNSKCRIRQYTNVPDPAYKKNKIEIEKYFFPHIIEHMKNGSIWYAD